MPEARLSNRPEGPVIGGLAASIGGALLVIAPSSEELAADRQTRRAIDRERDPRAARRELEAAASANGWGDWLAAIKRKVDPRTGEIRRERAVIPRSVLACLAESWSFVLQGDAELVLQTFRCKSWRCPRCAPMQTRALCGRIHDTFLGPVGERLEWGGPRIDPAECLFVTVTEDRKLHGSAWSAARSAGDRMRALLKRAREDAAREAGLGRLEARRAPMQTVQVWEQHARPDDAGQWLHVHAIVRCREAADLARREGTIEFQGEPWLVYGARLRRLAREGRSGRAGSLGFGLCNVQLLSDAEGLAAYLAKLQWLTAELGGTSGKANQVPVCAPRRFRRLRCSPGFLRRRERPPSPWRSAAVATGSAALAGRLAALADRWRRDWVAADVAEAVAFVLRDGPGKLLAWVRGLPRLPAAAEPPEAARAAP